MSASTRLKNEALEAAREAGNIQPTGKTEPGASLANTDPITPNFSELAPPTASNVSRETPAATHTRPDITAAEKYDPILRSGNEPANTNTPPQQSYEQRMREAVQEARSEQGRGSEMVQSQQPAPSPTNTTPEGKAQDAKTFNQNWNAEQGKANDYQQRMAEAVQEARDEQANEPEQDQQQEQGHSR